MSCCPGPIRSKLAAASPTDPAGPVASPDGVTESLHELTQRARKDPAVSRLLTEFGAQVVDVRPLRPGVDDAGKPLVVEEGG